MKASARTLLRVELHGVDLPGRSWYGRSPDGSVENFRGAKLRFAEIDPALIDQALQTGHPLVGRVMLTDEDGWPRCARLHPPAITWSIETP